ncbi:hypothetical protein BCV70DRAFT_198625 [Testicularia cyperi]|uniref:RRM domain-containing protein n=1 Tax=Testicularia cyperi TaxID=1882483 RepID=A0A317XVQ6_9BASI|nr:hypothetical protein BCV70DRAFT_198625 [Testicularia cyperi]
MAMPSGSLGKSTPVTHWVYARKHTASSSNAAGPSSSASIDELPSDRTLFLANLPVDTTESHLREIFSNAGALSLVRFRSQHAADGEEDEKEEKGAGEDEEEDDDDGTTPSVMPTKAGKKSKAPRIPKVTPLPKLDPREAMGAQPFLVTSSSAHVVFLDSGSLQRALDMLRQGIKWTDPFKALRKEAERQALLEAEAEQEQLRKGKKAKTTTSASFLLSAGAGIPPVGLEFLLEQFHACRPELEDVKAWADSRVALYAYRKAHPLPKKIGVRGVTVGPNGELLDEDGFIIVQRSGKYGRAGAPSDAGGSVAIAKRGYKENTEKKSTNLDDFYRFQVRDRKRQQLADLRAKFEQDKAKVASLKASRRFKPY